MSRQVDVKALISHIVKGDGLDKCRVCMGDTSQGQVHLTDTVMMDGDKAVTLSELLEIITGVEIKEETFCPGGVCVACASAALAAEEFRLFVRNAACLWRRAIINLTQLPYEASDNAKSVCAVVSPNITVDTHSDLDAGDATEVIDKLQSKLTKKHERKPRVLRAGPTVTCPDCNKQFSGPHLLQTHLQNSDRKDACGICGAVVPIGAGLKYHLATVHREPAILCKECPTVVVTEAELKTHQNLAHKPGALNCSACGRTFTRKGSYESHIQMHVVLTCRLCGTQFSNRSCFRQHRSFCEPNAKPKSIPRIRRSNNRDPGQYVCDYCQKMYSSRPQLKNHILWIHLDHRPHQCSFCGKRFYTSARLNEHTVVHTRVRNFECDLCDAKLVSKSAAIYHRRRHTGEKPYVCDDCGAAFISSSRRLEHAKRKHNKGIRFQCTECTASFVRRRELEKHVAKNHKAIAKCEVFESGFKV